jgi:PAS domain S-box-containing protein
VSETSHSSLIHALPVAIYTCDAEGRVREYNQAAADLWGRRPKIGTDLWCGSWKIYRPNGASIPSAEYPLAIALREGRTIRDEEIIIECPDGSRRHVLANPKPLVNEAGAIVGAINMLVDITRSRQAERAMAHLAAIVQSSDDAIISKDLQGIVTSWNEGAERLFGYKAEEMIGRPVSLLIPEERHDEEPSILQRIARGEQVSHYETIRRRKDGTKLHISLTVSPIIDRQGRIIGVSKIARDITERTMIEAALRERDQALTETNKELEAFSYAVAHDLRAPIRTTDAFVRTVLEEHSHKLDDEGRRCLNIIQSAARQAGQLIHDLLELARLGRQAMHKEAIQLTDVIQEVLKDLEMERKGRNIELTVDDFPVCLGDRRLLTLAFMNLLSNALKFTRPKPTAKIHVGWRADTNRSDRYVCFVQDNGLGFDMRYAHKLFSVFQRLHPKTEVEGTGVGLAIVERIIQRHGGTVWAEGQVNEGATFYLTLECPKGSSHNVRRP